MTRFTFRLEPVLAWRKAQLEAEEFRLKELLAAREQLGKEIADIEGEHLRAEWQVRHCATVAAADLWALAAYREAARARSERLARTRQEHDTGILAQREKLAGARQRCRLLERLKEKRHAEWQYASAREMEAFAGDAYLSRWKTP